MLSVLNTLPGISLCFDSYCIYQYCDEYNAVIVASVQSTCTCIVLYKILDHNFAGQFIVCRAKEQF